MKNIYVGRKWSEIESAVKATHSLYRVHGPNSLLTADFVTTRVNFLLDENLEYVVDVYTG